MLSANQSYLDFPNTVLISAPNLTEDTQIKYDPFENINHLQSGIATNIFAPFNNYPIQTLKMIGMLIIDRHSWAILRLPDGTIRAVTIDETIGLENGRVIDINAKQVTIQLSGEQDKVIDLTSE